MRSFFDGLDAAQEPVPREARCAAALAPRMLELSAERALGAHTYFVPVEHTRATRELLGEGPLIATELACVLDTDLGRARASARGYAELYLGLRNYTTNLRRFGFGDEDLGGGGSDRLIDAVVPHGDAEAIAAVARAHLDAGADHVCLQPVGVSGVPREQWTALASALIVLAAACTLTSLPSRWRACSPSTRSPRRAASGMSTGAMRRRRAWPR